MHGMGDGIISLQRDHGQSEHWQLWTQDSKEAGNLTGDGQLPLDGVLSELSKGRSIQNCQESWK